MLTVFFVLELLDARGSSQATFFFGEAELCPVWMQHAGRLVWVDIPHSHLAAVVGCFVRKTF
jgi:hypothetical protein